MQTVISIGKCRKPIVFAVIAAFGMLGCERKGDVSPAEQTLVEQPRATQAPPMPEVGAHHPINTASELDNALAKATALQPQLAAQLSALVPTQARHGALRFTHPIVENPNVAPFFLKRLTDNRDPSEIRTALVEALPRTHGNWSRFAVEVLRNEQDPEVRRRLVAIMPDAEPELGLQGIRVGLTDAVANVRMEATISAGFLSQGVELSEELIEALHDSDVLVRAGAARSLGVLQVHSAFTSISNLLSDTTADVRLEALSALNRIDPVRLKAHTAMRSLSTDPDIRVSRIANTLSATR